MALAMLNLGGIVTNHPGRSSFAQARVNAAADITCPRARARADVPEDRKFSRPPQCKPQPKVVFCVRSASGEQIKHAKKSIEYTSPDRTPHRLGTNFPPRE